MDRLIGSLDGGSGKTAISIQMAFSRLRCDASETIILPLACCPADCRFIAATRGWHVSCYILKGQLHAEKAFKVMPCHHTDQLQQKSQLMGFLPDDYPLKRNENEQ